MPIRHRPLSAPEATMSNRAWAERGLTTATSLTKFRIEDWSILVSLVWPIQYLAVPADLAWRAEDTADNSLRSLPHSRSGYSASAKIVRSQLL